MKKILGLSLALAIMGSAMVMPAHAAIETAGGNQEVPVVLSVQPAVFSVTVPTSLPVYISADGSVSTAGTANIQNESAAPVIVSDVTVVPNTGWTLINYATDPNTFKFGETKLGLSLNETPTDTNGEWEFDASKWAAIPKGGIYSFPYAAICPPQGETAHGTTMAYVTFTVGWAK